MPYWFFNAYLSSKVDATKEHYTSAVSEATTSITQNIIYVIYAINPLMLCCDLICDVYMWNNKI